MTTSSSTNQDNASFLGGSTSFENSRLESAHRVNLLTELLNEDVDAKKVYEHWFTATASDWTLREKYFVELLFHSIGWFSFTYDDFQFHVVRAFVTNQERAETSNPVMEPSYLLNYEEILECLFDYNNFSSDSGALRFLSSVVEAVRYLTGGSYDSYRLLAVRTGMKLLTLCFNVSKDSLSKLTESSQLSFTSNCSMSFEREPGESTMDSSSSFSIAGSRRQIMRIKKTMLDKFFPRAIRDVCQQVRQTVYREMLEWSRLNPAILLGSRWHNYIIFGLHDDKELYILSALKNLFQENSDREKQKELFEKIQTALMQHLIESGNSSFIAIEILSSAARYLDVASLLPSRDVESVFMHIYHPVKTVAVDAAKFLFFSRMLPHVEQPSLFLTDLVIFISESADLGLPSSEEMLVDAFCSIMGQFVKWEHWLELFNSCPPYLTLGSAKLFINYVKKLTTNHCPTGRSNTVGGVSKKDLREACDGFTTFLSIQYKTILNLDKVIMNPEARSLIIRSMMYFNKKISSNMALEIVTLLSKILRSNSTPGMIASCWSAINHLKNLVTFDTTAKMQFSSLLDSLRNHTIQDFMGFITYPKSRLDNKKIELQMLGLVKIGEFSDDVWDSCCEKLQSLLDLNPNSATIPLIVKVLYNIVFHQYKLVDESSQNVEEEEETRMDYEDPSQNLTMLVRRFSKLQKFALVLIGKQFCLNIRVEAFNVLSSGLECFGNHMSKHPTLILVCDIVDGRVESLLAEFTSEAMKWSSDNELVARGVCCNVFMRTSQQFGSNYIDLPKIGVLLALITPQRLRGAHIERHGVELMSALKLFLDNFPNSGRRVAIAIFKGVHEVFRDTLHENSESSLESTTDVVKKTVEYWRLFEDFEKVLQYPVVSQTLSTMFECMVRKTGEEQYRKLGQSLTSSRFSMPRIHPSVADDESVSVDEERPTPQDSVINYSAFRRTSGIGHSTFREPPASNDESQTDDRSES